MSDENRFFTSCRPNLYLVILSAHSQLCWPICSFTFYFSRSQPTGHEGSSGRDQPSKPPSACFKKWANMPNSNTDQSQILPTGSQGNRWRISLIDFELGHSRHGRTRTLQSVLLNFFRNHKRSSPSCLVTTPELIAQSADAYRPLCTNSSGPKTSRRTSKRSHE